MRLVILVPILNCDPARINYIAYKRTVSARGGKASHLDVAKILLFFFTIIHKIVMT